MEGKGAGLSRAAKRRKKVVDKKQGVTHVAAASGTTADGAVATPAPPRKHEAVSNQQFMDLIHNHAIDSKTKATMLLAQIISPTTVEEFYQRHWEQSPLHIRRSSPRHFAGIFSRKSFESLTQEQSLVYGEDVDVTLYENGQRRTLNPEPEGPEGEEDNRIIAEHQDLWQFFKDGCSLRLLCPQKFDDNIWQLLSGLEDEFTSMVGCNMYLTPAGSQGFAPHYDDIEAFVLQLEGRKHWKIYSPKEDEILPRFPSQNIPQKDLSAPLMEITLEPGDTLYFPRGFVHQAVTVGDKASLHLTVSCAQLNSYADLLELCLPQSLASVVQKSLQVRRSLPAEYPEFMGASASGDDNDTRRRMFIATMRTMFMQVVEECVDVLDAATDQMAKKFIVDRLPPPIAPSDEEKMQTDAPIRPDSLFRVVRSGIARIVVEDGKAVVYHCMDNARVMHGAAIQPLEFELDDGPALEMLLNAYPAPVRVIDLPHPPTEDIDDKIGIAEALYKERLLVLVGNSTDHPHLLTGATNKRERPQRNADEEDGDDYDEEAEQEDEEDDEDAPW